MKHHPLILLGTHRSGTTWLGEAFSQAADVAYWSEPRHIWTYRNWFRKNDVLTEADANPAIVKYIRRRFEKFTDARKGQRFCEKTPSNCLRIRFIRQVFPEARFVLVMRDGRSVVRSTQEIVERGGARWKRMFHRIIESRPREWPAFLEKSTLVWNKLARSKNHYWGTRPPGWRDWINLEPTIFFAKQWSATMNRALDDFESIPQHQGLIVKYEHLVNDDSDAVDQLLEFSQVEDIRSVNAFICQTRRPDRADAWREAFTENELAQLRPEIEPTLVRMTYCW